MLFLDHITIAKRKNVPSKILLEIQKLKIRQMLCKSQAFRMSRISMCIKDGTCFLFAIDR